MKNKKKEKSMLEEIKTNAKKSSESRIKVLGVSSIDKKLKNKIKDLLKEEKLIEKITLKSPYESKSELYNILGIIRQQISFYVSLAHLKKQDRTNKLLISLTILVIILMVIQICQ